MRILLLTVGRCRERAMQAGAAGYLDRLEHYVQVTEKVVKEARAGKGTTPDTVIQTEGERLLKALPDKAYLIALDREGQAVGSEELSERLERLASRGLNRIVFAVGGAFGLSPDVLKRANWRLSLSAMTFPHEMSRLILLEQLYRAFTILKGEQYHK